MAINLTCSCGQTLRVPRPPADTVVTCPHCGNAWTLPKSSLWRNVAALSAISVLLAVTAYVGWCSHLACRYERQHLFEEKRQQLVRHQRYLLHQLEQVQAYLEDPQGLAVWRHDDGKVCYIQESTFPPTAGVPLPLDGTHWRQAVGRLLSTILVPIAADEEILEGTAQRNVYLECPRGFFHLSDVPADRVFVADQKSGERCLEILLTSEYVFTKFDAPEDAAAERTPEGASTEKIRQAVNDYVQAIDVFACQKGPMRSESLLVAAIVLGTGFALGCLMGPLRMFRKPRLEKPACREDRAQTA